MCLFIFSRLVLKAVPGQQPPSIYAKLEMPLPELSTKSKAAEAGIGHQARLLGMLAFPQCFGPSSSVPENVTLPLCSKPMYLAFSLF